MLEILLHPNSKAIEWMYHAQWLTTHMLFIERADWSKKPDMFKARDAKSWQREFPVGFPV